MISTIDTSALNIWNERCQHLAPRTFVIWYDCEQQQVIKTFGLTDLGYSDLQFRSWKSLCQLLHPDHQKTLDVLARGINSRLGRSAKTSLYAYWYRETMPDWNQGIYLSVACSVKNPKAHYWSAHAIVEPFIRSLNNKHSAFFIWVQISGEYMGEPLRGMFFSQKVERNESQVKLLNSKMIQLRLKILDGMRFSTKQYQQIGLMMQEPNAQKIAEKLKKSVRTIEGHRNAILQVGRSFFPEGSFDTAQEFLEYLQVIPPQNRQAQMPM